MKRFKSTVATAIRSTAVTASVVGGVALAQTSAPTTIEDENRRQSLDVGRRSMVGTALLAMLVVALGAQYVGQRPSAAEGPNAVVNVADCVTNTLPANDDGSTVAVPIGFEVQLGRRPDGVTPAVYSQLFVNNNGNVTFDSPLGTYTPFGISGARTKILAPFFADVDTRGVGSGLVRYGFGNTVYEGRRAFCVDWVNVGYYGAHADKLNSFQLLIVDRSEIGPGSFDVVMNFDKIEWETGDASGGSGGLGGVSAHMGYSDGSGNSFELPGSGVNGALLDSSTTGLVHRSLNSLQLGRYVFAIRNGAIPTGHEIAGRVLSSSDGSPVGNALVAACGTAGFCRSTLAGTDGRYSVPGLDPDTYTLQAFPPSGSSLFPGQRSGVVLGSADLAGVDIALDGPRPLPNGTTITDRYVNANGTPVVYWREPLSLVTHACSGGTASYQILQSATVISSGPMTEGPPGTYSTTVPQLYPNHGDARVVITVSCETSPISFDIYIDPSGVVTLVDHTTPVASATVTLYRSDSSSGPFTLVPAGSAVMSSVNRNNPDTTDAAGHFGWDVFPGFYKVRAEKSGCHAPGNTSELFTESNVLTIPPAVTDLHLELDCPVVNTPPTVVVPANRTVEGNTTGGANVAFSASASDAQDGTLVPTCTPASGSLFGLGTTTVTCSATDHGPGTPLTTTAQFDVTVRDTTPPTVDCPAPVNQRVGSTVSLGTARAVDIVDAHPVVTNDAPASFGPGATTVIWKARDASGNAASCTQMVTLTYGFEGFFPPDSDGMPANAGRAIPVKWKLTDAAGNTIADPAVVSSASFDAPGGTYTLSFEEGQFVLVAKTARDWRGVKTFSFRLNDGTVHTFKVNFS
ncbi:MAG: HYR domain-containing protein [Actinobacteria bacterium]|nr:HYR domain-containing protein [Actinomycetota bacterium]